MDYETHSYSYSLASGWNLICPVLELTLSEFTSSSPYIVEIQSQNAKWVKNNNFNIIILNINFIDALIYGYKNVKKKTL